MNFILPTYTYLALLVLANILPINGRESALNNNYILEIRLDYIVHALMTAVLTLLALRYAGEYHYSIILTIFLVILISASLEGLQYFISWRTFNVNDLVGNGVGVGVGVIVWILFKRNVLKNSRLRNK